MKKIYVPAVTEKYAAVVAPDESFSWTFMQELHSRKLISEWKVPAFTWHKKHKNKKIPKITTCGTCSWICFESSFISYVFPELPQAIELLPITIEGASWYLINAVGLVNEYDVRTLDCSRLPFNPPVQLNTRWINVVDQRAFMFEVFRVAQINDLFFSEAVVNRLKFADDIGLNFYHVGHMVETFSQIVLSPPRVPDVPPWDPLYYADASKITLPSQAPESSKPPIKAKALTLSVTQQRILTRAGQRFTKRLQLQADAADETVLDALTDEVQRLRPLRNDLGYEEQEKLLQELSHPFGELLCKRCDWHWVTLKYPRANSYYGVATADQAHAIYLAPFFIRQLDSDEPPTIKLLFNMICAGNVPPAKAGDLIELQ